MSTTGRGFLSRDDSHDEQSNLDQVAGEIAHEIANPLALIYLQCEKLTQFQNSAGSSLNSEAVASIAQSIQSTCSRIEAIMKGLRSFNSDQRETESRSFKVRRLVELAIETCKARQGESVTSIRVNIQNDELSVVGEGNQILQVLVNLLNNAYEAVRHNENFWVELGIQESRDAVHFSVTDSGSGIDPAMRARIMQPFFSTKSDGRGLGLSIAKKIIERHGRHLKIDADCPNTRFVFELQKFVEK